MITKCDIEYDNNNYIKSKWLLIVGLRETSHIIRPLGLLCIETEKISFGYGHKIYVLKNERTN